MIYLYSYKSYIEGLRGIAVLSVIFFHAGYSFMPGGYLGVDIFFVLSGFLILQTLSHRINNKSSSFIDYYKKRVLRIIPAAFFVILMVFFIGSILFFPEELSNLYNNIYFNLIGQSNVLASKGVDYFGLKVSYQPLIHYWSLSVELQFYIFFPLIIYIFLKNHYEAFLLKLFTLFIVISIFIILNIEITNSEKYFSTWLRLWEFILGSSAFLILKLYEAKINSCKYNHFFSSLGLFVLVISLFIFDDSYMILGINTIIPTVGVFLILLFTREAFYTSKLLSSSLLKKTGIISYSLYLVHQPVFVFYRTIIDSDFSLFESLFLIGIVFILGYFLWKCIEYPLQKKGKNFILVLIFILWGISYLFICNIKDKKLNEYTVNDRINKYLFYRYNNNPRIKECRVSNKIINPSNACVYGDKTETKNIVLWGDSHIDQIAFELSKELNKQGYNVIELSVAGCPPIIDIDLKNKARKCYQNSKVIFDYILSHNEYKDIVIFAYWNYYVNEKQIVYSKNSVDGNLTSELLKTLEQLDKKDKRIHLIYPIAEMKVNPPFHKARLEKILPYNNITISIKEEDYNRNVYNAIRMLDNVTARINVNKIHISNYFKINDSYIANKGDVVYYRDSNHLSSTGGGKHVSSGIARKIIDYIIRSEVEE